MKILVIGTKGSIGSYAAYALIVDGHEVIGLDNVIDYYSVALEEMRHGRLESRDRYEGVRGNLEDNGSPNATT